MIFNHNHQLHKDSGHFVTLTCELARYTKELKQIIDDWFRLGRK